MMDKEMRDKQPLMHLFSKYVIRPNAFDRDPFILPKAAQLNKHYHTYGNQGKPQQFQPDNNFKRNNASKPQTTAAETLGDDFETVEAPKKKVKPVKIQEETEAPVEAVKEVIEAVKEAPKAAPAEVKKVEAKAATAKVDKKTQEKPIERPQTAPVKKETPKVQEEEKKAPEPVAEAPKETKPALEVPVLLKGPRPKGLKKFKKVEVVEAETPPEELSENQKRKIENKAKKAEDQARQKEEEERQAKLKAIEAEKEKKRKLEAEKQAKQKAFEEE